MKKLVGKILEIASHRNGVCGKPFYAIRFTAVEAEGEFFAAVPHAEEGDDGECYVIRTSRLPEEGVTFGRNSWRGDRYEPELRQAIKKFENLPARMYGMGKPITGDDLKKARK